MRLLQVKILCVFIVSITLSYAQEGIHQHSSSMLFGIAAPDSLVLPTDDSIQSVTDELQSITDIDSLESTSSVVFITDTTDLPVAVELNQFKPNPTKAVIYAAIFPGLGQIYNGKYWKLPIVYGGFLGFSYAISWNHRYYIDYSNGYKDIMGDDPEKDSWKNFLPY